MSGSGGDPPSALPPANFLVKLSLLRDFVAGCGYRFGEADLSACLRGCGLNVEAAAERLVTGQFKCSSAAKAGPAKAVGGSGGGGPNGSSSARRRVTPSPPEVGKRRRQHQAAREPQPKSQPTPQPQPQPPGGLLLCARWIVGLGTVRGGRVGHGERLALSCSSSGPPIVRFRGRALEGTLPPRESSMLAPLLRHGGAAGQKQGQKRKRARGTGTGTGTGTGFEPGTAGASGPLVSVSAEALMEDFCMGIGSEVPLSLRVRIEDPQAFFALFGDAGGGGGAGDEDCEGGGGGGGDGGARLAGRREGSSPPQPRRPTVCCSGRSMGTFHPSCRQGTAWTGERAGTNPGTEPGTTARSRPRGPNRS